MKHEQVIVSHTFCRCNYLSMTQDSVVVQLIFHSKRRSVLYIEMLPFQERNPHYENKTVSHLSYVFNENPYIRKDNLYIETGPRWWDRTHPKELTWFVWVYDLVIDFSCLRTQTVMWQLLWVHCDPCWTHSSLLTVNMLNCFNDYKRYINILNCILDLAWPK